MLLILARFIAIYIAVTGITFLINPKALKPYTAFWGQKKRLYFIGGSRLLMGLVLLLAVPQCRLKTVVVILGILIISAGIPYFILRLERQKTMVSRWGNRPAVLVRILGFLILSIGILLLCSV